MVINTDKERSLLMEKLADNNLSSVTLIKRVYIPKSNCKSRPLGLDLPTILDRCRQVVVKSALEPYLKAKFEGYSYGLDHDEVVTMQYRECLVLFVPELLGIGY
ncbi:reverse transcriptase [Orientia tsutsugamushi]|nr:reverse transcriptase [Orientia tsutsugamushi]